MWKRFIGVAVSSGGDDSAEQASTSSSGENKEEAKKEDPPKELSNAGDSSDVTIKVGAVDTRPEVGNEFTKETAQGVFKIIEVTLTNNQKHAITVDANSFKLIDVQGREFTYSSDGQIAFDIGENEGNSDFFLQSLNPGLNQTGKIFFDVPADAKGLVLNARGGMMGEEITLKVE